MRAILFTLLSLLATTPAAAAGPSLAAQDGRWVCLPDDPAAPQVLVDFEENAYRRCDQNTCTSYDIQSVRRHGAVTEILFAPDSRLRAIDTGGQFTELRKAGDAIVVSTGTCAHRGDGLDADGIDNGAIQRDGQAPRSPRTRT